MSWKVKTPDGKIVATCEVNPNQHRLLRYPVKDEARNSDVQGLVGRGWITIVSAIKLKEFYWSILSDDAEVLSSLKDTTVFQLVEQQ